MLKINTNQDIYLYEKRIIFQETIRGWSIVIMPDNIIGSYIRYFGLMVYAIAIAPLAFNKIWKE